MGRGVRAAEEKEERSGGKGQEGTEEGTGEEGGVMEVASKRHSSYHRRP